MMPDEFPESSPTKDREDEEARMVASDPVRMARYLLLLEGRVGQLEEALARLTSKEPERESEAEADMERLAHDIRWVRNMTLLRSGGEMVEASLDHVMPADYQRAVNNVLDKVSAFLAHAPPRESQPHRCLYPWQHDRGCECASESQPQPSSTKEPRFDFEADEARWRDLDMVIVDYGERIDVLEKKVAAHLRAPSPVQPSSEDGSIGDIRSIVKQARESEHAWMKDAALDYVLRHLTSSVRPPSTEEPVDVLPGFVVECDRPGAPDARYTVQILGGTGEEIPPDHQPVSLVFAHPNTGEDHG